MRVSIIMATFNCQNTLKKCVDSILNQTYTDWEFIICDDCSFDKTYEMLLAYKEQYPDKFVILKNEKNSKLSYSLNRCLEMSKGEYVARMDGDDIADSNRLDRQVEFLDENLEYSVVGTAMTPFDEKGFRPVRYAKEVPQKMDMLNGPPFFHATIMMRREAYKKVNGYLVSKRTVRGQDYDMWFRFFAAELKGYNLQESLYYVLEDDAAMKRRTLKNRFYEAQTKLKGYKMLEYPCYMYIYALKPLLAAAVPSQIMQKYHVYVDRKRKR